MYVPSHKKSWTRSYPTPLTADVMGEDVIRAYFAGLLAACMLMFHHVAIIKTAYRKAPPLDLETVPGTTPARTDSELAYNNNAAGEQPRIARKSSLLQTKIPLPIEISAPGELSARQGNFAESRGKFPSKRRR